MELKNVAVIGGLILVGGLALKMFGGFEGLSGMFKGATDFFSDIGGGGSTAGAVGIITPETAAQIDILSDMTIPEVALIAETQEIESTYDVLQTASLIAGPIGYLAAPLLLDPLEKQQKADALKKYVSRTVKEQETYIPSPTVIIKGEDRPVWVQGSDLISDTARPEGSFGGR